MIARYLSTSQQVLSVRRTPKWTSGGVLLRNLGDESVRRLRSEAVQFARARFADLDNERDAETARVRKERDLIRLSRTKYTYQCKVAERAEEAIDVEIQRRITRSQWSTGPLYGFSRLPDELRAKICSHAMHVQPMIRPWCYDGPVLHRMAKELAPEPTDLRQVPWLREVTGQVLFSGTTFSFIMPATLHEFLDMESDDSLQHLRRVELLFEVDVLLKYLNDFLPFNFYPVPHFLRNQVGNLRIQHALKELNRHAKRKFDADGTQLRVIIIFPYTFRMWHARSEGRCHMGLCKWIVKAAQQAVQGYPCLEVIFEGAVTDEHEDMTKAQRAAVRAFKKKAATIPREELDAKPGSEVGQPPPCRCNKQTQDA